MEGFRVRKTRDHYLENVGTSLQTVLLGFKPIVEFSSYVPMKGESPFEPFYASVWKTEIPLKKALAKVRSACYALYNNYKKQSLNLRRQDVDNLEGAEICRPFALDDQGRPLTGLSVNTTIETFMDISEFAACMESAHNFVQIFINTHFGRIIIDGLYTDKDKAKNDKIVGEMQVVSSFNLSDIVSELTIETSSVFSGHNCSSRDALFSAYRDLMKNYGLPSKKQ